MMSTHYRNGYSDIYITLTKVADDTYDYPPPPRRSLGGAITGGITGALGAGATGVIGKHLYDTFQGREDLRNYLQNFLQDPRVREERMTHMAPNLIDPFSPAGAVHPEAKFLYGLNPDELERLKGPYGMGAARNMMTPERIGGALEKLKGVEGFGRYALARKGVPLLSALHWGLPAAAIGLAAGGLLGS